MTNKQTLTKEQAEAVQALIELRGDTPIKEIHEIIIQEKLNGGWLNSGTFRAANSINNMDFIDALRNGYEVETTKFQSDLKIYRRADVSTRSARDHSSIYLEEVFPEIYQIVKERHGNYQVGQYVSKNELVNILNDTEKVVIETKAELYSTFGLQSRFIVKQVDVDSPWE